MQLLCVRIIKPHLLNFWVSVEKPEISFFDIISMFIQHGILDQLI